MPVTTLDGHQVHVNEEGFLTDPTEWDDDLGKVLAAQIGITLTDEHWNAIRFLRKDFDEQGETATLRRVSTVGGIPIKALFALFPQKPAKKMAYVSGLPKPHGCV
jgi:tRNA 2-thiouridine synthesizing protein E